MYNKLVWIVVLILLLGNGHDNQEKRQTAQKAKL